MCVIMVDGSGGGSRACTARLRDVMIMSDDSGGGENQANTARLVRTEHTLHACVML
jgi:hypothetical protein